MTKIETGQLQHIAQCVGLNQKGRPVPLDFYRLTKKDQAVIDKLKKSIGQSNFIGQNALDDAAIAGDVRDVFVAATENKFCGIISGINFNKTPGQKFYSISNFATCAVSRKFWVGSKQKIKNAGEGLLELMLKTAQDIGAKGVELYSTPKAVPFYKNHGFKFGFPEKIVRESRTQFLILPSLEEQRGAIYAKIQEIGMHFRGQ